MSSLQWMQKTRAIALANQLKFRKLSKAVQCWFEFRNIEIQSEIWIYPMYPRKWRAVVAAKNWVWTLEYDPKYRKIVILQIEETKGFYPNGALITRAVGTSDREYYEIYDLYLLSKIKGTEK